PSRNQIKICILRVAAAGQKRRSAMFMVEGAITGARRVSTGIQHSTGVYRQDLNITLAAS
ncbi:hypothetical protein, partial [Pseudomonas aeruginosa]|uniref:hypothetical protein n=1 Tax=Pseudomonas aeruginosa TaxID=287 RepID=UPI001968FEDA